MTLRLKIFLAALAALLLAGAAFALSVPPAPSGRVNDYAGLFMPEETRALEARLKAIEEANSNQIVVAVFKTLEGDSLEDFSIRLADAWKLGHKGRDNGVLLLIIKDDRKVRIEVGKGLEGAITDALSGRIIRDVLAPPFREGNYAAGVAGAVDALDKASRGEFTALEKKGPGKKPSAGASAFFIFIAFFLFMAISRLFSSRQIGRRGGGGGIFFFPMGGGWGHGGGGGFGGGGFGGGGGGGGFGGGGASGGW